MKYGLSLAAIRGGEQIVQIEAKADASLRQVATASVNVVAPSVKVAIDGPRLRYLGRGATYTLTVRNDGTVSTNNVRVMHKVPVGFKFVSAQNGGKFDPATNNISWFVGRVGPGQSSKLSVRLLANQLGKHVHHVQVASEHGALATAQMKTAIEGTASLILKIVELDDPVEVGRETAYEVRITNKGSKAGQQRWRLVRTLGRRQSGGRDRSDRPCHLEGRLADL